MTRFRWLLFVVFLGLTSITLPAAAIPDLRFVAIATRLDLALSTGVTLAALAVATLAWVRYSEGEDVHLLYQAAAFLGLFVGDGLRLGAVMLGMDDRLRMSLQNAGQTPIYLWTLQASVAGALLTIGGVASLRRWPRESNRARPIIGVPALIILVGGLLIMAYANELPVVATPPTVEQLSGEAVVTVRGGLPLPVLMIQLALSTAFFAAALLKARIYELNGQLATAYLAAGLLVAAFAEIHFAGVPSGYTSLLTAWDLLRALFYAVLLVGVAVGARHDLRSLNLAYVALRRLRRTDARRAALEERARVAREVHDGLIQDLWLARLKQASLQRVADLPQDVKQLAAEADQAMESALREAREGLALMMPITLRSSLGEAASELVSDFSNRFGLPVALEVHGEPGELERTVQSELLGIIREALNNARKHAGATRALVRVKTDTGRLTITVSDDGRGFQAEAQHSGFGLRSMHQRAGMIGGRLNLDTRPGGGTVVTVELSLRGQQEWSVVDVPRA